MGRIPQYAPIDEYPWYLACDDGYWRYADRIGDQNKLGGGE